MILSLACDTILIISQEALFVILTASAYSILPSIAGGLGFSFKENYHWSRPIRSLGIRADDLVMGTVPVQLDLFMNEQRREKQEKLDRAVDEIRRRFGYHSVQRAFMYQDKVLSSLDAQKSHTVHPVGYFNGR